MGASGEDILLSEAAISSLPYSIECKSRAAVSVYPWFEQACTNANGRTPLLVIKQNASKPLVLLDMDDFFRIISENTKNG